MAVVRKIKYVVEIELGYLLASSNDIPKIRDSVIKYLTSEDIKIPFSFNFKGIGDTLLILKDFENVSSCVTMNKLVTEYIQKIKGDFK